MPTLTEHSIQSGLDFTLSHPDVDSKGLVMYLPGFATDRYGGLGDDVPSPAVQSALIELAQDSYTLAFPDLYSMSRLGPTEDFHAPSVEQLGDRVNDVLRCVQQETPASYLAFVSECLGSLVIGSVARTINVPKAEAFMWSPITDEGDHHLQAWRLAFGVTEMDSRGNGLLPVSKGARNVKVTQAFWNSMDRNSLRNRYAAIGEAFDKVTVLYPTNDPIFPDNKTYLSVHAPDFELVPIQGNKHRPNKEPMLSELTDAMAERLVTR